MQTDSQHEAEVIDIALDVISGENESNRWDPFTNTASIFANPVRPNLETLAIWATILESDLYKQTKGTLYNGYEYCCVGVLSNQLGASWERGGNEYFPVVGGLRADASGILPHQFQQAIGMIDRRSIFLPRGFDQSAFNGPFDVQSGDPFVFDDAGWHCRRVFDELARPANSLHFVNFASLNDDLGLSFRGIAQVIWCIIDAWKVFDEYASLHATRP